MPGLTALSAVSSTLKKRFQIQPFQRGCTAVAWSKRAKQINSPLLFLSLCLAFSEPLPASPLFYCDKAHMAWIPTGSFLDSLPLFVCYRLDKMIFTLRVCFVLAEMAWMSELILSPSLTPSLHHLRFFYIKIPHCPVHGGDLERIRWVWEEATLRGSVYIQVHGGKKCIRK